MNCEEAIRTFLNARDHGIDCNTAVDQHINECEACRREIAEIDKLFDVMDKDEFLLPPSSIRKAFEITLANEMAIQKKSAAPVKAIFPFSLRTAAAACILLFAGIFIGYLLTHTKDSRSVVKDSTGKRTDSVIALPYPSSSDRIEMINTSVEASAANDSLLVTLTNIFVNDKNSNVRMAALYALTKYANDPYVHKRLVSSLAKEAEPVIQVLLINLLIEKKGPGAIDAIQNLIKNEGTRTEVKMVAETKLRSI